MSVTTVRLELFTVIEKVGRVLKKKKKKNIGALKPQSSQKKHEVQVLIHFALEGDFLNSKYYTNNVAIRNINQGG